MNRAFQPPPANDPVGNVELLSRWLVGAAISAARCRAAVADTPDLSRALEAAAKRYDELVGRYARAVDCAERTVKRASA